MQKSASTARDPLAVGLAVIIGITAYRLALLPLATADLFVDETQYWQWGQTLDWGYYSKPPLIGWVLRAVTDLAGSDSAFWIRMPGAVFHAATALLIIGAANEVTNRAAAVMTGLAYLTLPFVTVGAFLISTDTILLPFFAAALWLWLRLAQASSLALAGVLGLCLGLGFMAKYAAIYFALGAAVGALLLPQARIAWLDLAIAACVFAVVVTPNIIWNLQNDLVTLSHTADNADWVGQSFALHPDRAAEFFGAQFLVMGPVLFGAYLWAVWQAMRQPDWRLKFLVATSAPILLLVLGQALLSRAYANWAVTAFVAATILTVPMLWNRARLVLWVGLAVNMAAAVALPVVVTGADRWMARDGERLLLRRFVGRAETSAAILRAADRAGVSTIVSSHRDLLADLFYAARDLDITIYGMPTGGPPTNYYVQRFPLPEDFAGPVLHADFQLAPCDGTLFATIQAGPAYRDRVIDAQLVDAWCWETQ